MTGWGFLGLLCTAIASVGAQLTLRILGGSVVTAGPVADPVLLVLMLFALVAFAWTVYAWIQAVQATFALDLQRSIVTVALPLLVVIALNWAWLSLSAL